MNKAASGICPECDTPYKEHIYPEKVPCPDCYSIEHVHAWEAWGHPNGQLLCNQCMGYNNPRVGLYERRYHTFYKGENGKTVIVPWHTVDDESVDE